MNRKDAFKKVIRLAPKDQPNANFTDNTMNIVQADVEREAVLKTLLQQQMAEGPSFNFTANVMDQLNAQSKLAVFKPIISKQAWCCIAAVMAVFIMLIGLVNTSTQHRDTGGSIVADTVSYMRLIPSLYLIVLALAAALLLVDLRFTKRFKKIDSA